MQMNRLFEMVYLLMERGGMTASELAGRFEVSTRTVYRDIDTLSAAGIPIYTSKGKGGGIRLVSDFVLDRSLLSEDEQSQLLAGLQGLNAIHTPDVEPALRKLAALFGRERASWLEVDFTRWGDGDAERRRFFDLKDAILQSKIITFYYCNSTGEQYQRTVEPLKILFKGQDWYLYAFCREKQDYRVFKLTRIRQLTMSGEHFNREIPFSVKTDAVNQQQLIPVKLKIDCQLAFRVYDEFGPEQIKRLSDGSFLVTAQLPGGDWLKSVILSYGCAAEVLEPKDLRDQIASAVKNMVGRYQ